MARRARLMLGGVAVHIVQRGNNRNACFFGDGDRLFYLHHLGELAFEFGCAVHAYVLMGNHVHLLLTPTTSHGASLLMKQLGQCYVQYVNRRYQRSGTLWEGRFHSCLTQSERYVLACYRYIELNPVRAGMVRHPRDHPWSSYRTNAEGAPSRFVRPHEQYARLERSEDARREVYRSLFDAELDAETLTGIRRASRGNCALGDGGFEADVESLLGRRRSGSDPASARLRPSGSDPDL